MHFKTVLSNWQNVNIRVILLTIFWVQKYLSSKYLLVNKQYVITSSDTSYEFYFESSDEQNNIHMFVL